MTLETFNLLLAVGGGVLVPAAVGVVATTLVRRGDRRLAGQSTIRISEVSDDQTRQPADLEHEPVPA